MNFIFPVLFTNVVKEKHPHKEEMYNSDLFIQVKISPTQSTQLVLVFIAQCKIVSAHHFLLSPDMLPTGKWPSFYHIFLKERKLRLKP